MKNAFESDFRACPVCGNALVERVQPLGSLDNPRSAGCREYHLVACGRCEVIYLTPLPTQDVFDDIYIKHMQFLDCDEYRGERARLALDYYSDRMRALTQKLHTESQQFRILEIGSGLSWMCRATKLLVSGSLTVAQDVTAEAVTTCPWVDHYFVGEITEQLQNLRTHAPYHVISMTHVIEHLPSPRDTLVSLKELLAENGTVFITAPYRPAGWEPSRPFDIWRKWSYNHVPGHLQYFNQKSLTLCARKSGLSVSFYQNNGDNGQAFEAWLVRSCGSPA